MSAPGPEHRLRLRATVELYRLQAEATCARERLRLFRAQTYSWCASGPRGTEPSHLRKLERLSNLAEARLERAEANYTRPNTNEGAV